jgi:hypothetical protein
MPYQVDDATRHVMYGTELSRVRTELRLLLREHINQRLLASRAADIVMQSSEIKYLKDQCYGARAIFILRALFRRIFAEKSAFR